MLAKQNIISIFGVETELTVFVNYFNKINTMDFLVFGLGTTEIVLIVAVVLLLFGGTKLPQLMRGMGRGVREFKEGMNTPIEEQEKQEEERKNK